MPQAVSGIILIFVCNKGTDMMTVCEQHFYERVPSALIDLVDAVKKLTKEVAELKEEIKGLKEDSAE